MQSNCLGGAYYRFLKQERANFCFLGEQELLPLEKEAQRELGFQTFRLI